MKEGGRKKWRREGADRRRWWWGRRRESGGVSMGFPFSLMRQPRRQATTQKTQDEQNQNHTAHASNEEVAQPMREGGRR